MMVKSRYVHTNIIARDWKGLARFYEKVFGCIRVPPERDLSGEWLEDATGVKGAGIRGIHLRLPGHGENGPTLEIFQYNHMEKSRGTAVNRPGLAHIAFLVDDVDAARRAVIDAGGGGVGEIVTLDLPGVGGITFVYVTDPEGNIIELQRIT
jgi:predicted enzyme related to lactoylglutathione lyase